MFTVARCGTPQSRPLDSGHLVEFRGIGGEIVGNIHRKSF